MVLCFVDFAAARESVDRDSFWRIMRADGMPENLLRLIKGDYQYVCMCVLKFSVYGCVCVCLKKKKKEVI